jgi:hypothetical protein
LPVNIYAFHDRHQHTAKPMPAQAAGLDSTAGPPVFMNKPHKVFGTLWGLREFFLERETGFEPATSTLASRKSIPVQTGYIYQNLKKMQAKITPVF